jgi:RNA polymerase sigma factor (sigma-70 family)
VADADLQSRVRGKRGRYFAAVVLGTALTTGGATASAVAGRVEPQARAVNDISRYCTTCWRNAHLPPDIWPDCTQEVFSRLLERVAPDHWQRMLAGESQERREFLRAIDAVKKRSQRARRWYSSPDDVVADRRGTEERRIADDREIIQHVSAQCLGARQQEILRLSFDGWSVHEIASRLQISPARVSDEKYKAIQKLRERVQHT